MDIKDILSKCDHTLLSQTATWEDIKAICDDGMKYHTASVCIPPCYVKEAKEYVGDRLAICTVIGFPNGYNTTAVKNFETADALKTVRTKSIWSSISVRSKRATINMSRTKSKRSNKLAETKSSKSSSRLACSRTMKNQDVPNRNARGRGLYKDVYGLFKVGRNF